MPSKNFKYAYSLAEGVIEGFDPQESPKELYQNAIGLLENLVQDGENKEGFEAWPVEGRLKGRFLGLGGKRLDSPELEEAIEEISAAVYSATKKKTGMTLRPIQVATGIRSILPPSGDSSDNSNSLEVLTNEGKTYELPFATAFFAAAGRHTGKKTFVLSANDYLVARDAELTGGIYQELGISDIGVLRKASNGVPIGFKYVDGGFSNAVSLFAKSKGPVNLDEKTFAAVSDLERREMEISRTFNQALSEGNVQGFFDFLGTLGYDPKVDVIFNPGLEYSARLSKKGLVKVYGEGADKGEWEYLPFAMWGLKTGAISLDNPHLMPVSVASARGSEIVFSTPDAYSASIREQIAKGDTLDLVGKNKAYFVVDEADKTVAKLLENVAPQVTVPVDNRHLPAIYAAINSDGGLRHFKKEYSADGRSPEAQVAASVGIDPALSEKAMKAALEGFVTKGLSKQEAKRKLSEIEKDGVKRGPKSGGLGDFVTAISSELDAGMLADYVALETYDVVESKEQGIEFTRNFTRKLERAGLYDAKAVDAYSEATILLSNAIEDRFSGEKKGVRGDVQDTLGLSGRISSALDSAVYGRDYSFDGNGDLDIEKSPGFYTLLFSLGGGSDPRENEILRGFLSERNEKDAEALVTAKLQNKRGKNYEVVNGQVRIMNDGKIKGAGFSGEIQNYLETIEGVPLTMQQSYAPYELSAIATSLSENPFVAFSATLGGAERALDLMGSTSPEAVPTYAEDGYSRKEFSLVEVGADGKMSSAKPSDIGAVGREFRYVKYGDDGETVVESRFVPKEGGIKILGDKKSHYSEIAGLAKEGLSRGEGVVIAVNTIQNAADLGKALSDDTKAPVRVVYGQDALSEASVYRLVSEGITIVLPEAGRGVNFPTKGKPMRLIVAEVPQNSVEEHHLLNRVARDSPGEIFRVYNANDPMISNTFRTLDEAQKEVFVENFFLDSMEKGLRTATAYFAESLKGAVGSSRERAAESLEYLRIRAEIASLPEKELREYAGKVVSETISGILDSARGGDAGYVDPESASRKLAQVLPGSEAHWTSVVEGAMYASASKGSFGASIPEDALSADLSRIYTDAISSIPAKEIRAALISQADARMGIASQYARIRGGSPRASISEASIYQDVGTGFTQYVLGKAAEKGLVQ